MFPILFLAAVVVLATVGFLIKSEVDPDMHIAEARRKAFRSRIMGWALVYILGVTVWWFWNPIQRFVEQHKAQGFVEEHRPK